MAMSDPLGDMLTRIRNGQMAQQAAPSRPGLQAARERARGAAARGLHPRLRAEDWRAASASCASSSSTTMASR